MQRKTVLTWFAFSRLAMMASTSSALGHKQTDRQKDRGTVTEETLPRFNKQTNVKKNKKLKNKPVVIIMGAVCKIT